MINDYKELKNFNIEFINFGLNYQKILMVLMIIINNFKF